VPIHLQQPKSLLAKAGYSHGFTFDIMASHYLPSDFTAAEIIQQQLKPLGLTPPPSRSSSVNRYVDDTRFPYPAVPDPGTR